MHSRANIIYKLIKRTGYDISNFSFASVIRCVTKSKSVITPEIFKHCFNSYLKQEIKDINPEAIIAFGAIAGECLIPGRNIQNIEEVRNNIFMYDEIPFVVTYSLSVLSKGGCSSCTSSGARQHLVLKDMEKLLIHLKKKGIKLVK